MESLANTQKSKVKAKKQYIFVAPPDEAEQGNKKKVKKASGADDESKTNKENREPIKLKNQEVKPKNMEAKPKNKEAEPKNKDAEPENNEANNPKNKEAKSKNKEAKVKKQEAKTKEQEPKEAKNKESKAKKQELKMNKEPKRKKEKKILQFHNCQFIRFWPFLEMACHYTNMDTLKVKRSKNGRLMKCSVIDSNNAIADADGSIAEFALQTAEDGYGLARCENEPNKCFWISRNANERIGYLFIFPTAEKANEFCAFMSSADGAQQQKDDEPKAVEKEASDAVNNAVEEYDEEEGQQNDEDVEELEQQFGEDPFSPNYQSTSNGGFFP